MSKTLRIRLAVDSSTAKKAAWVLEQILKPYAVDLAFVDKDHTGKGYDLLYTADATEIGKKTKAILPSDPETWALAPADIWLDTDLIEKPELSALFRRDPIRVLFAFMADEISWQPETAPTLDQHGRFLPGSDQLAILPARCVVALQRKLAQILSLSPQYGRVPKLMLSMDLDNLLVGWKGLAYRFWKNLPSLNFSIKEHREVYRASVHRMLDQFEDHQLKVVIFLKAPVEPTRHPLDARDYLDAPQAVDVLGRLKNHPLVEVGLHSTYEASHQPKTLTAEKERLETWLGRPIHIHRSHYLRYRYPQSFEALYEMGFKVDSSIAWPYSPVSRSGLRHAYPLFNPHTQQAMALKEVPMTFMDLVSAREPEESFRKLEQQSRRLRSEGGCVSWDFHHTSYDSLLFPNNAAVFEHALHLIANYEITCIHSDEL